MYFLSLAINMMFMTGAVTFDIYSSMVMYNRPWKRALHKYSRSWLYYAHVPVTIVFCLQAGSIPMPMYVIGMAEIMELAYYCAVGTVIEVCVSYNF